MILKLFFIFFVLIFARGDYVISVLNDVHLDLKYDPYADVKSFCQEGGTKDSTYAPYGRHGCDSPYSLFKSTLKKMVEVNPNPNLIIVPGDLVTHMVSSEKDTFNLTDYAELKRVIENHTREVAMSFPNTPIVFTLGNNDYAMNYQVPNKTYKEDYYSFVFQKIVTEIKANGISVIIVINYRIHLRILRCLSRLVVTL